jgi:hypothetical protein
MACPRCGDPDHDPLRRLWCVDCELSYDVWSRRHASDIAWEALAGMVVVASVGVGLPLLGVSWVAAVMGIFAGFGTILGLHRLNGRRRRRQYLRSGDMPRAYLPGRTQP